MSQDVRLDAPLLSGGRPSQSSYSSTDATHSSSASSIALSFDADTGEQVFVDPHVPIRTLPLTLAHIGAVAFDEIQLFLPLFSDEVRFPLCQSLLCLLFASTFLVLRAEHIRLKRAGYLSRTTSNNHLLWPLFTAVFGALSSTTVFAFMPHDRSLSGLSEVQILQLLCSVQNAVLLVLLFRYTYACLKHNLGRALPECHDMDESDAVYLPYTPFGNGSMDASGNYGFASVNGGARPSFEGPALTGLDGSSVVGGGKGAAAAKNSSPSASSLARKQTHMIGYLQEQVKTLSLEILRLRSAAEFRGLTGATGAGTGSSFDGASGGSGAIGGGGGNGGSGYRVGASGDLDHLLAAKEQEMRAIAAERDRLRADAARAVERADAMRKSVELLRDERERNAAKIGELQREVDQVGKKYAKLKLLVEVEQEAVQHAQSALQFYKTANNSSSASGGNAGTP